MKRHILFLAILAIIWIVPCYGDPIGRDKAVTIAGRFLRNGGSRTLDASLKVTNDVPGTKAPEEVPYFIVEDPAGGFVIVSNETAMVPILGYSYTGSTGTGMQMPPALKEWLNAVAEGVSQIRRKGCAASSETRQLWGRVQAVTKSGSGVPPVMEIETARWGQSYPFNALCPEFNGKPTVAGCVPIATAIVMRYHKWPDYPVNVHVEEYKGIKETSNMWGGWDIDYAWDWDNMPLTDGQGFTPEQTHAVAVLVRDIGALINAKYGVGSTGASQLNAEILSRELGYETMRYVDHSFYTHDEFVNFVRNDIREGLPVLLTGGNVESPVGHAFVADGIDTEGNIRINWGWNGRSNGYYSLAPFAYLDETINPNYFYNMDGWVGIRPERGRPMLPEPMILSINIYGDPLVLTEQFSVYFMYHFSDCPNKTYRNDIQCEMVLGVRDKDGKLKELVSEIFVPADGGHHRCLLSRYPEYGDYLCVNYRYDDSEEWKEARYDMGQDHGRCLLNEPEPLASKTSVYITRTNHLEPMGSFFRDSKVIKINTIKGTYAELYYAHDGIEEILNDALFISDNGQYDYPEGVYYIYLDELKAGRYIVRLKKDLQKYEFSFEI